MRLGVVDILSLAVSLIFAIPVANFGVLRLLAGETLLGGAMVAVAIAMVVVPQFLFDPRRLVRRLVVGLLPRRLRHIRDNAGSERTSDAQAGDEPSDDTSSERV